MKKISILLFFLISFSGYSQSVKLRDLMEHFLQKDDSLQIIKQREIQKDGVIVVQKNIIKSDSVRITIYQKDSLLFRNVIHRKDSIIDNKDKEAKIVKKENKKQKRKLIGSVIGLSLLEVGTLILLIISLK